MRKLMIIAVVVLLTTTSLFGQTVLNPSFVSRDETSLTIDKIEIGTYNTIVYCTHTAPEHYSNGGWVTIAPTTFLKESYGTRRYELIKAEGIPLAPDKFNYSYTGQKLSFRLIFQKVATDIQRIDMIECETNKNCFNFYGLKVRESSYSNTAPIERSGRKFLRDQIKEWGQCKNVAMTLTGGDVAIYGANGWAAQGAPISMTKKLKELNSTDNLIDDLVLTEDGSWLILWGNNGISSYGTPPSLYSKLEKWNNENEVIMSVTFNDRGDWIAITKTKYSASSEKVMDYIKEGEREYGEFWAAHLTNDGMVLCYENGYKFLGNVPENLKKKLRETNINVFRIKFLSDGSYFIADSKGNYAYNM